jgi:hypothetical protein
MYLNESWPRDTSQYIASAIVANALDLDGCDISPSSICHHASLRRHISIRFPVRSEFLLERR